MTLPLPENAILFGRQPDLKYLESRVRTQGLTFIVGQPRMGKTWLVSRFCENLEKEGRWLFGYYESTADEHDLLSSTVADLYRRWLTQASYKDQLKSILERHRGEMMGKAGTAVGAILSAVINLPTPGIGDMVANVFQGLKAAADDLKTGGRQFQPVPYDICRDLVSIVYKISGQPILVVMDAWEQGKDLRNDFSSLKKMLGRLHEWPKDLHIFVVVREGSQYSGCHELVKELCATSTFACAKYPLPPMHLATDPEEEKRIINHIRSEVPGAKGLEDAAILDMMDGNPAVLEAWEKLRPESEEAIHQTARDAHVLRDWEFETLFPKLLESDRDMFDLATRLALLPEFVSVRKWEELKPIVLCGRPETDLAELESRGILKQEKPPSFGHTTKYESAQNWLIQNSRSKPLARATVRAMVSDLAARIRYIDERDLYFSATLAALYEPVMRLEETDHLSVLCVAAATLFGMEPPQEIKEKFESVLRTISDEIPEARVLVAASLFNTLNQAKEEKDLNRRDALLQELRDLAGQYPDDPAVRENLAMGLFNTLNQAKEEKNLNRRDALLQELRDLAGQYPDDPAVREQLARGLFNTLNQAKEEKDLNRRDALLKELRDLAGQYPDDPAVREQLARGLVNTLNQAKEEKDLNRRDALLKELRDLAGQYPDDPAVREGLARGLFNTLIDAKEAKDLNRRDALLKELRDLAGQYPDDPAVRKRLAMGLFNTLIDAKEEKDLNRRDALLKELRDLAGKYPDDPAVREQLAMGLVNTLIDAKEEKDLNRRDALLQELRDLAGQYPDDPAVRERLARGLFNTLIDAKEEKDLNRRDALLKELRDLAGQYPDDPAVREQLAKGLVKTLIDAKEEKDLNRRDMLQQELRYLQKSYPDERIFQEIAQALG